MARPSAGFWIKKWYLDCVSDEGMVFVGYAGRVRLGPIPLSYQATLLCAPDGTSTQRFTLVPATMPSLTDGEVTWRNRWLSVTGSWQRTAPAAARVLLDDASLKVDWHCHAPACETRVTVGGVEIQGPGYAEVLEVSGPLAKLPIEELRWGRFVSEGHHLVWIDWRGESPLALLLANGAFVVPVRIDDDVVESPSAILTMRDRRVLRSGAVDGAVFGRSALLARLLPAGVGGWVEEKWVSRARLERDGGDAVEGWAIHERVRIG